MSGLRILLQERGGTTIISEGMCEMNLGESYSITHLTVHNCSTAVNISEYEGNFDDVIV